MDRWNGLVAAVTGASSGIGRAVAVALAKQGMIVVAIARREDKLKELAATFKGKGKIVAMKGDVSNEEDVNRIFRDIEKNIGQVRVLINNAGVLINTVLTDFDLKVWRTMFDLNLLGLAACTKCVVQSAVKNKPGQVHIINVNSIVGHEVVNYGNIEVYSMTKRCLTMLTNNLMKNLPKNNIRFTSLSPGAVDTEIFEVGGLPKASGLAMLAPENVANAAIAALSADSNVVLSEITIRPLGEEF